MVDVCTAESCVRAAASGGETARRKEASRAVPVENFDLVVPPAVCGGVEDAVGVEVSDDNAMRMG